MSIQKIIYDESNQAILADGEYVVDLSSVEDGATAILHSRVAQEDEGLKATFRFKADEYSPFCLHFPSCLGFANLSPVTLIKVIVENRLQLSGLKYSSEIEKVYRIVKNWTIDNIFSGNDFPHPQIEQ